MMNALPLETCWAFNERWNNKFCYKVASCWLFLLNHTAMHGSMNIKFINAKQATETHGYKNTKRELYKTNAAIWFNKSCREFPLRLDYGRSPHAYVNQRLQIQLELLMMSYVPLETCWAFNERWNNKFCYKVASCWLFPLNHTAMHGSMNIKFVVLVPSTPSTLLCLSSSRLFFLGGGYCRRIFLYKIPHRKKSGGVRSGDRGGQAHAWHCDHRRTPAKKISLLCLQYG